MPSQKEREKQRIAGILRRLEERFPEAECALIHRSPFELLMATILSAQCTDERVNRVTSVLFERFPGPHELAEADLDELQEIIRSTGFFRNKAKSLRGACQKIVENFQGNVPRTMEELLTLPGVARKTANVVLGTWYGIADGVVVDTHVRRLSQRLGLTRQKEPKTIERDLMKKIPQKEWIAFSHRLIHHGRQTCKAQKPRCEECTLAELCPHATALK